MDTQTPHQLNKPGYLFHTVCSSFGLDYLWSSSFNRGAPMISGQIAIVIQSSNLSTEQLERIAHALTLNMFGVSTINVVPLDVPSFLALEDMINIQ